MDHVTPPARFPAHAPPEMREAYLDLLKRCLLNWLYADAEDRLVRAQGALERTRLAGRDWPVLGQTMVGLARLGNVQACAEAVLREGVAGDFLEAGVWRGGVCVLLRGVLHAHGVTDRAVWAADSFAGLPPPSPERYPHDAGLDLHRFPQLAVPLDRVKYHFARYGLLDDRVRFLPGWFKDTLPTAPVEKLALLRIDGDLYESTTDVLKACYPKVCPGGFVLVDDYGDIAACRHAVDDYREAHGVTEPITPVDWTGVYWRKSPA